MSDEVEEVSWETEELERWIINECPENIFWRSARSGADALKTDVEQFGLFEMIDKVTGQDFFIDKRLVDWEYLAKELGE